MPLGKQKENSGAAAWVAAIDIYTRKGFASIIQGERSPGNVLDATRPLWTNETVKEIGCDQDTAFTTNGAFALAVRNEAGASVRFKPVRGSVNDLAVVDRFISEIKSRLFRSMRDQDTGGRWVDLLPVKVKNYNEKTSLKHRQLFGFKICTQR